MGLVDTDIFIDNLKQIIIDRDGNPDYLEELGLLENTPVKKLDTPIDTLCSYLLKQLAIGKFVLVDYHFLGFKGFVWKFQGFFLNFRNYFQSFSF